MYTLYFLLPLLIIYIIYIYILLYFFFRFIVKIYDVDIVDEEPHFVGYSAIKHDYFYY